MGRSVKIGLVILAVLSIGLSGLTGYMIPFVHQEGEEYYINSDLVISPNTCQVFSFWWGEEYISDIDVSIAKRQEENFVVSIAIVPHNTNLTAFEQECSWENLTFYFNTTINVNSTMNSYIDFDIPFSENKLYRADVVVLGGNASSKMPNFDYSQSMMQIWIDTKPEFSLTWRIWGIVIITELVGIILGLYCIVIAKRIS